MRLSLAALLLFSATAAAQSPPETRALDYSFRQLGHYQPVQLRGVDGSLSLPFGVRLDEVVSSAQLRLRYAYSPALLPEISHLRVSLNGETVGTLPLPRAGSGAETEATLNLDPRYFTDYNQLRIQLIGHYTLECEDPQHSSLWATLSPESSVQLTLKPLRLADELALLPAPFFDRRDSRRLKLSFVLPQQADVETLRSAGVLASWFGALADYRGAEFSAHRGELPPGHSVVFAINQQGPAGLSLPVVQDAQIAVMDHPTDPGAKLLVLQGRDSAQLSEAVQALVLGQGVLTGARASVRGVQLPPRRAAYDAPKWLRTDRPVRLGELVEHPRDLQAQGLAPAPLTLNLRVPPDLFPWKNRGVPLDLRYRYTSPVAQDNSLLSISINDEFIQALRLRPQDAPGGSRLLVPLLDNDLAGRSESLLIPAFRVGADNQLQFQFALDYHKSGPCQGSVVDLARAGIDPDSTIDFSDFPHYATLPNLALYANAGFPFTKYADLAETLVVLPALDDPAAVSEMLTLLGRLGRHTGAAGLRVQLTAASDLAADADADLLVIGGGARDLLKEWEGAAPVHLDAASREYRVLPPARWYAPWQPRRETVPEAGAVQFKASGEMAALLGFESPLRPRRSVVMLTATDSAARAQVLDALLDDGRVREMRGDTVLLRGAQLSSQHSGRAYTVGELPWMLALWMWLSRHPLLIVLFAVVTGLLGALIVNRYLQKVAARRLQL